MKNLALIAISCVSLSGCGHKTTLEEFCPDTAITGSYEASPADTASAQVAAEKLCERGWSRNGCDLYFEAGGRSGPVLYHLSAQKNDISGTVKVSTGVLNKTDGKYHDAAIPASCYTGTSSCKISQLDRIAQIEYNMTENKYHRDHVEVLEEHLESRLNCIKKYYRRKS